MPSLFSMNLEERTAYEKRDWKEECVFCSHAGNCGAECTEWCPLKDEED